MTIAPCARLQRVAQTIGIQLLDFISLIHAAHGGVP